jgi:hypothetical protein
LSDCYVNSLAITVLVPGAFVNKVIIYEFKVGVIAGTSKLLGQIKKVSDVFDDDCITA